jgi:hypothetical protein
MSTIEPDVIVLGSRIDGNSIYGHYQHDAHSVAAGMARTNLLSWVSRTATPASTLPTVNETSILTATVCERRILTQELNVQSPRLQGCIRARVVLLAQNYQEASLLT